MSTEENLSNLKAHQLFGLFADLTTLDRTYFFPLSDFIIIVVCVMKQMCSWLLRHRPILIINICNLVHSKGCSCSLSSGCKVLWLPHFGFLKI